MSNFRYTRHTFRPDGLYHKETLELGELELIGHIGRCGRQAFVELINNWNRLGLIGLPGDRPIYVFVAEDAL